MLKCIDQFISDCFHHRHIFHLIITGGEVGFEGDARDQLRFGRARDVVESKVLEFEAVCRVSPSRRCISQHSECTAVGEFAREEILEDIAWAYSADAQRIHPQPSYAG